MATSAKDLFSRRKFPRRRFHRSTGFLYKGEYFMGMGSEIGEGGMSVVLPAEFQVENQAVASFQILDGSFISVRVELRNIRKLPTGEHLVGCSFRGLKFEHKREIRAYVSARSELEQ